MNRFFITGYPRSRTAWLANLFTTGDVFCYHEAEVMCGGLENSIDMLCQKTGKIVGNSCSAILIRQDVYKKHFPNARYLLVKRNPLEVRVGIERIFSRELTNIQIDHVMDVILKQVTSFVENFGPMVVEYENLNDEAEIKRIWKHLLPNGPEIDMVRYRMLNSMNIQLTEEALKLRRDAICLG